MDMSKAGGHDDMKPTLMQVIGSVLAAGFGVQSRRNQERDFGYGSLGTFLIVGFVATGVFGLIIYGVVDLVLRSAGG